MKAVFALCAAMVAGAQAFVPTTTAFSGARVALPASTSTAATTPRMAAGSFGVFESAQTEFAEEFPEYSKYGWGPTAKAERWNGRHAMFGWAAIIATGYCQAHNLIPNAEVALDPKVWGTLAYTTGTETITNERAIIMIGHVHALAVSVCATVAPLSFQDKLFLDVEAGEKDEPAPGLIPSFVPGLTPEAEIFNGRMAMMGLVVTATVALTTGQSFLDVVNAGLGGLLL
ncbi:unnamed protein product [Scytosiphon promiscuus]